ncbi:MAG: hypothetical protein ABIY37_14755 [Devosia sp.]
MALARPVSRAERPAVHAIHHRAHGGRARSQFLFVEPDFGPVLLGLANFLAIPRDARAVNSIVKTAYLILIGVVPTVIVSFLVAVLANTKLPGIRIIRTIYLMPLVISFVASAVLWRFVFDARFGPINTLLSWVGIDGPNWLQSTS